jgi:hypothetical protein
MNAEILKLLLPVIVAGVRGIRDICEDDIEQMTLQEIREMLIESEDAWPELDFGQD